jgi:hypothetical protein
MQVGEIVWVSVDKLKPNTYNPNVMNPEKFEALCDFLRTHRAEELDPIWVRNDGANGFEVIDGEHRWKAANEVGWKRLRAFVLPIDENDAKSFNVRKNRERGNIDAIKFGKIITEEYERRLDIEDSHKRDEIVGAKFGLKNRQARYYRSVYEKREEIQHYLKTQGHHSALVSIGLAKRILDHLKSRGKDETKPNLPKFDEEAVDKTQTVERFLSDYKEALKKMPKDATKTDDIQVAVRFFKKLLVEKQVTCPICGEAHLQWRCGHDF